MESKFVKITNIISISISLVALAISIVALILNYNLDKKQYNLDTEENLLITESLQSSLSESVIINLKDNEGES